MPNFGKKSALKDELNTNLLFVAFFACMGAFTFGFDNGWWGGVLGHPYFNEVFGQPVTDPTTGVTTHALTSTQISVPTAMGTACIGIGCMAAGYIADLIGRKKSFYVTAVGSIIGTVIEATSGIGGGRYWQLAAGKFVICLAIGVASVSVPLYLAECAPAPVRGALINSYVEVQSLGGLMAIGVIYGILPKTGQIVWVLPIALQCMAPVVTLCVAHMLPESPRWLLEKGRIDEARAALLFLRKNRVGYNVDEDINALEAAHQERLQKKAVTWLECFKGRDLYRTNVAISVQSLQQGQGLSFIANYLVIFFIQLGIQNPYTILLIVYAFLVCCTAGGFFTQDYFGRRVLLICGGAVMGLSMFALAGVVSSTPDGVVSGTKSNLCVAFIVLWLFAFTQSWTNIPWTASAEVPAEHLRDKTLAIGAFSGYMSGMVVGLVSPYLQGAPANMGGKIGFIWGAISLFTCVYVYFVVPELKGRSLTEIDYMYDIGVPARQMGTYVIDQDALPTTQQPSIGEEVIDEKNEKAGAELSHIDRL